VTTMRSLVVLTALAAFVALAPVPADAQSFTVTIKNHKFSPSELKVPAGKRITVTVVNDDPTPEEFESRELKIEKVIPGKSKGVVRFGPLTKGRYKFFGEYHEDTAQGAVVVE
jgi:plastocyanin